MVYSRLFYKEVQYNALEKKSNVDYLEEVGWKQFIPEVILDKIPVG